uniref:Zn(2)-C6 fungal-type domain-containing protein n=1 Tax=Bionectria ochroleuca TaxID=29856 RepID=A0A8H7K7K6_BIOOC
MNPIYADTTSLRSLPCVECREKHLKCTLDGKKCRRCRARNLPCIGAGRKQPFRMGTSTRLDSQFPETQTWVKTNAREFRLHNGSRGRAKRIETECEADGPASSPQPPLDRVTPSSSPGLAASTPTASSPHIYPSWSELLHHSPDGVPQQEQCGEEDDRITVQEACLLNYYIDELSHWFDTCDHQRRFEFLVPERAMSYPPLLNAIYAVSARHLCRLPRFRTKEGIVYRGQVLHGLTPGTAVEYMLQCMPALRAFHDTFDEDTRTLTLTTAVILRQFEEMEYDNEAGEEEGSAAVDSELLNACYWIALRQEVYDALLKGYLPEMDQNPQSYGNVTPANRMIMHASHVTRWMFEGKSQEGWLTLKEQERSLEEEVATQFKPLMWLPPNREKGEVFPTIWFRSVAAITAMQHMMLARMILIAESPFLAHATDPRLAFREAEGQVRGIVLDICGTSLQEEKTPPVVVNAALAIHLYGHYFIDWYERKALKRVIDRFSDARAWPVPKQLQDYQLSP